MPAATHSILKNVLPCAALASQPRNSKRGHEEGEWGRSIGGEERLDGIRVAAELREMEKWRRGEGEGQCLGWLVVTGVTTHTVYSAIYAPYLH
jgi:hypothetical protein